MVNLALEMVESVSWSTSIGVLGHATLGFGTYGLLLWMVSDLNLSEHRQGGRA